jgi:hypothetical protein
VDDRTQRFTRRRPNRSLPILRDRQRDLFGDPSRPEVPSRHAATLVWMIFGRVVLMSQLLRRPDNHRTTTGIPERNVWIAAAVVACIFDSSELCIHFLDSNFVQTCNQLTTQTRSGWSRTKVMPLSHFRVCWPSRNALIRWNHEQRGGLTFWEEIRQPQERTLLRRFFESFGGPLQTHRVHLELAWNAGVAAVMFLNSKGQEHRVLVETDSCVG